MRFDLQKDESIGHDSIHPLPIDQSFEGQEYILLLTAPIDL